MKTVLGCVRRACEDFDMIKPGDKIGVGVSGGKDSLLLLYALHLYQKFSPVPFEIEALTLTMGLEPFDLTGVHAMCEKLNIPYTVLPTVIGKVVFEIRKEKNPCSLCAKMRRGALHDLALSRGINKIALGQHMDDAIETLLMSLLFEGRINTFQPVTYLTRKKITMIRPLLYVPEKHIKQVAKHLALPIVPSPCAANGFTKRQDIKELLNTLSKTYPDIREKMLAALRNRKQYCLWDKSYRGGDVPIEIDEIDE